MADNPDPQKPKVPPPDIKKGPPPGDARKGPPPPDIRKGPPPAPAPSMLHSPPDPPRPGLKVSIAEDDDGDEEFEEEGVHGSAASLQDRVLATVIDVVLAAGVWFGVDMLLPEFLDRVVNLIPVAYLLTRDSLPFLGGQSVGKKAMRIQAVTTDGASLAGNWKPGIIRNVVLLIPLFPLVELFVLISRQDKPVPAIRLGDEWAGTKVIHVEIPVGADGSPVPGGESPTATGTGEGEG